MDESVCEQEREKQTLLKVRTHMSAYILERSARVILSIHVSCIHLLLCYMYSRHTCAELLSCSHSACWFRFDVELEVQHRSRADAVRVPVDGCYGDHDGPSSDGGFNLTPKGQIKTHCSLCTTAAK